MDNTATEVNPKISVETNLLFQIKDSISDIIVTSLGVSAMLYLLLMTFIKLYFLIPLILIFILLLIWDGIRITSFYDNKVTFKKKRGFFKDKLIQFEIEKIEKVVLRQIVSSGYSSGSVRFVFKDNAGIGMKKLGFTMPVSNDMYPICEWLLKNKVPIETKSPSVQDKIYNIKKGLWKS
jgi:hypothetical protein